MNTSQYNISLGSAKKLLKDYGLIKQTIKKDGKFSQESIFASKEGASLFDSYLVCVRNRDYDILMFDDSLIQFSYDATCAKPPQIRYAFYQNPIDVHTYQEFLFQEHNISGVEFLDTLYQDDYEQIVSESHLKKHPVVVRYDSSKIEYTEAIHPVSHFHIGMKNDIRLPLKFHLTPLGFVFFIIKQVYYAQWKTLVTDASFLDRYRDFKRNCTMLGNEHFKDNDAIELYFQ